jgi:hypothetical protein
MRSMHHRAHDYVVFSHPCYLVPVLPTIFLSTLLSDSHSLCFLHQYVRPSLCKCVNVIQKSLDLYKWFVLLQCFNCHNSRTNKTVPIFLTLVDFQLEAQNSYLFIYNTFIKTF